MASKAWPQRHGLGASRLSIIVTLVREIEVATVTLNHDHRSNEACCASSGGDDPVGQSQPCTFFDVQGSVHSLMQHEVLGLQVTMRKVWLY